MRKKTNWYKTVKGKEWSCVKHNYQTDDDDGKSNWRVLKLDHDKR